MEKVEGLPCDAAIFDLEDAVAPERKDEAREALRGHFRSHPKPGKERVIRINGLDTPWGTEDLLAARACLPDAILIPKVERTADLRAVADALAETDVPETLRLWAMIETPLAIMNLGAIAMSDAAPDVKPDCFVVGTNDLFAAAGLAAQGAREHGHGWLMQVILAARAGAIDVLDGVYNDFSDAAGFAAQCEQAVAMGFDGKTLIHPGQIAAANAAFAPDPASISRAQAIVAAYDAPENDGKGAVAIDGMMVERLHLAQSRALLARAAAIAERDQAGFDRQDKKQKG